MGWDPGTVLFGGLLVLTIVVVFVLAARAQRQPAPEGVVDVAAWVNEGRSLFTIWQERVERLDELNRRLAAMAEEIGHLRSQVARIDGLRTDVERLEQEVGRARAERDDLQEVLARIGDLAQQAVTKTPPKASE